MNLILCFLLAKFSLFNYPSNYKPKEDAVIECNLKKEVIKEAEAKYPVLCIGEGGGGFENRRVYALMFNHYGRLSIDESRELIVKLVDICIDRFDSCKELKPFLDKKKIDKKNFSVSLYLKAKAGDEVNKREFSICSFRRGDIKYMNTVNALDCMIFEETYEEAVEKIASQKG